MHTIDEVLAQHEFTRGMRPEHLQWIAGCGRNVVLQPGTYVLHEGGDSRWFYLLREGRIALEVASRERGAITVETIHGGDVLGWSWLFPPYRCAFDARVVELTRAIQFDGACLRQKADADHELGYELMKRLAKVFTGRLAATRLQLLDLYGAPGPQPPAAAPAMGPQPGGRP